MTRLRFMALSPDGRLFLTDMHDQTDNKRGTVYVLDGWDEKEGRYRRSHTYLDSLHNPNQVAFHVEQGDTSIYVTTTDRLLRFVYHAGDTVPIGEPAIIAMFPSQGLSYRYGGSHLTRSLAFNAGKLYVSVGSSCNACIETEEMRATILEMDPFGRNSRIYATGLRNAVGLKWVMGDLFATDLGSDQFGSNAPEDRLLVIHDQAFYGWPFFFQSGQRVFADTAFTHRGSSPLLAPEPAYAALGSHTAALGFDYLNDFNDDALRNWFLVALHGSSEPKLNKGYQIVRVRKGEPAVPIVTGFLKNDQRFGRPCDVRMRDANSFWFTDDLNGVLYLVRRKRS